MRRNKVLFVSNGYPTQFTPGLCPFIRSQVEDLREIKIWVDVLSCSDVEKHRYFYVFKRFFYIHHRYEVIHIHHGLTFILLVPFLLRKKKTIVVSFLNNIEREYDEFKLAVIRHFFVKLTFLFLRILKVHVIEKNERYTRNFNFYSVLPNGVDSRVFQPVDSLSARRNLGLPNDRIILLFVSSKNLNRHQKRRDRFEFLVSLSERFYPLFVSGVNPIEMKDYYSAADYHVIVSEMEGSPNSVKESLSCGTPVLALDVGDITRIVEGDQNSRVFESFDVMCNYFIDVVSRIEPFSVKSNPKVIFENGYDRLQIANRLVELYNFNGNL